MKHLNIFVLGQFQISCEGQSLKDQLKFNSARALLVYLIMEGGTHKRSQMARLLWPDSGQYDARNNLRQTIFKLRQVVGKEAIHTTRQIIALVGGETIDIDIAVVQAALDDYAQTGALEALQTAVDGYTGAFLDEVLWNSVPFQEWRIRVREQLHRRMMEAFDILIADSIANSRWQSAETLLNRQLHFDPARESAHRQLIHTLMMQGKRQAAIDQFEQSQRVLQNDEMMVELRAQLNI